jgi:hypothetical protein
MVPVVKFSPLFPQYPVPPLQQNSVVRINNLKGHCANGLMEVGKQSFLYFKESMNLNGFFKRQRDISHYGKVVNGVWVLMKLE